MSRTFVTFLVLQALDFGTTAGVLALGGAEQNPLVLQFMKMGSVQGVAMAKLVTVAIGAGCYLAKKHHALRLANVAFTLIAVWNAGVLFLLAA